MTDVKIKCDSCKFVDGCVDYGWGECKKFTPKPSEPMTKLCDTCEYLKYCARSGIEEVGCDRYKKDMTTNEEWFCNLSTEEKATFLAIQIRLGVEFYRTNDERYQNHDWWVEWLKQPHSSPK